MIYRTILCRNDIQDEVFVPSVIHTTIRRTMLFDDNKTKMATKPENMYTEEKSKEDAPGKVKHKRQDERRVKRKKDSNCLENLSLEAR